MGSYLESAKKLRASLDKAGAMLTDEQAIKVTPIFANWAADAAYVVGDRRRYNGVLYKCLQSHMAQETWTPDTAVSLWAKVLTDPSGGILAWVQPDSTNPYMKGDKVTHKGKTWESLIDNNVWEPGVVGTESLWKEVAA